MVKMLNDCNLIKKMPPLSLSAFFYSQESNID